MVDNVIRMHKSSITAISSMATRQVLAELAAAFEEREGAAVAIESIGGVDAAKRVAAGEPFDVVILASDAIDKLQSAGRVVAGSKTDWVLSGVAAAVRDGATKPAIDSEDALRDAVLAAKTVGYSTGPSGTALAALFERWGIAEVLKPRIVLAPPGMPVGSLVASGQAELGFQQLSEFIHEPGIEVLGPLPASIQIHTVFSAGLVTGSAQPEAARALLAFLASPDTAAAKRRQGLEPV